MLPVRFLLPAVVVLLAGCSTPAPAVEGETVTIDNCGFEVHVPEDPQRIVTIKSVATELVLALGAGERLVGTAFSDGPVPAEFEGSAKGAVELSDSAPGNEAVLSVEPELVIAGWESNLTAENAGEREDLAELGVATYVAPPACQEPEYQPSPLTFDHIFDFISETGELIGEPERAAEIVAKQQETLEAITPVEGQPTALWYSSGSDIPFVGGGTGAPQLLMETAGLKNINSDVEDTWESIAWEAIADADPDLIILVDSAWNSVDHKIEVLESNPVTAAMPAVANERYLVIDFPASEAGIRSVAAAADLATQAADLEW